MPNPAIKPTLTIDPTTMEVLRVRIGLLNTDTSKDVVITEAWTMTLAWLESYLDRFLVAGNYVEVITHKRGITVGLKGYPVDVVNAITDNASPSISTLEHFHVDYPSGVLCFDGYLYQHQFTVDYDISDPVVGGLLFVALQVFDQVKVILGYDGSTAAGSGAIKSISSDGAKVDFDVGSGSASAGSVDIESGLPVNVLGLLNTFKRYTC